MRAAQVLSSSAQTGLGLEAYFTAIGSLESLAKESPQEFGKLSLQQVLLVTTPFLIWTVAALLLYFLSPIVVSILMYYTERVAGECI